MGVMLGIIGKTGFFRVYKPQWIWGKRGVQGVPGDDAGPYRRVTKNSQLEPPKAKM